MLTDLMSGYMVKSLHGADVRRLLQRGERALKRYIVDWLHGYNGNAPAMFCAICAELRRHTRQTWGELKAIGRPAFPRWPPPYTAFLEGRRSESAMGGVSAHGRANDCLTRFASFRFTSLYFALLRLAGGLPPSPMFKASAVARNSYDGRRGGKLFLRPRGGRGQAGAFKAIQPFSTLFFRFFELPHGKERREFCAI